MLAELLDVERVPTREFQRPRDGILRVCCPFALSGQDERGARIVVSERADMRKAEQALGIGARLARQPGNVRQSGGCESQRQLLLSNTVQSADQGAELRLLRELDLVEGERYPRLLRFRRFA